MVEVSENEELERVIPIIERIKNNFEINISIDSKKHRVIDEAIKCGAEIVNDISMIEDENILKVLNNHDVFYVLGHYRKNEAHQNLIPEVLIDISKKIDLLISSGFDRSKIILDPGIGFGKNLNHNVALLNRLSLFHSLRVPIAIGVSRKSFIASLNEDEPPDQRLAGSLAMAIWACQQGVQILRVHDVAETKQALKIYKAVVDDDL